MSTTIDQKVVEMRFDNKQFESGARTSISTLEKLKQSLNLTGSAKGLENVGTAAGKLNTSMTPLGTAVETVRTKFSALEIMGVTALVNITNSAVNAGKRIVSALTIQPVGDGFKEYEMMLNTVQTTMAGTGKTAKEVEAELKKLDEYADKTVYNTADMLNNLPKFTNAGVELENATTAMIGIANATALAGGDAGKASIAFYNLGQAIGTGYLTRMDYNSINNAGIATMEWKEQMVEAAIAMGTLKRVGDDTYQAGKKTLTLQQLFIDGLQEQWATTDVMMKVFQDYGDETTTIGKKAYSAAQDIKTYTQMMESLKATAGTGWKDTWQAIFGDLDAAKTFWTELTNFIGGIITKTADVRNKIVNVAMGSPLATMAKKIEGITDTVKSAAKPLKEYSEIVDKIIRGDFGNQWDNGDKDYRKKLVEAAGYDYATAQNLVNEKLGSSVRLTSELTKAQKEQSTQQSKNIDQLAEMSEKQLKQLGYTDEQIEAIKTLAKYAEDAGVSLSEFIKNMDEMSGREMLIESFKNAGKGLSTIFKSMKDAFLDIFPISAESIGLRIYSVLMKIYNFSQRWDISKNTDTIDKLTRTFKGLFAALDIVATIIGGPIKIAWKVLSQLLGVFDLDILSVTSKIGDAIVKFHDWLDSVLDFTGVFKWLKPYIEKAVTAVQKWINAVKPMEKVAGVFKKVGDAIKNFGKSIWESDIVQNIIDGLTNGLRNGATKVWNAIVTMAKGMITKIKDVLGIHSPSTEFQEVGKNAIDGLILGLKNGLGAIGDVIKALCSKMLDVFGNLDWSSVSSLFTNLAKVFPQLKILNFISGLGGLFSIGGKDVMSGLANGLSEGASAVWNAIVAVANKVIDTFKNILGIHSPSKVFFAIGGFIIAGLIGGLLDGTGNIKDALVTIGATITNFFKDLNLGTIIAGAAGIGSLLLFKETLEIVDKFGDAAKGIGEFTSSMGKLAKVVEQDGLKGLLTGKTTKVSKFATIAKAILTIAGAIALLAGVVFVFTKIDPKSLWNAIGAITALAVVIGALTITIDKIQGSKNIDTIGPMLMKVAGAMAVMALVAKILGSMDASTLWQGVAAITAFGLIIVGLMYATKLINGTKNVDKIGKTLVKVAGAMLIMSLVAKIAGSMEGEKLAKGTSAILAFALIISGLMFVTKLLTGSKNVDKIGGTILKISGAILILLGVAKLASMMSPEDFIKGYAAIIAFGGIIVGLMAATKLIAGGNKDIGAIGSTIFKIAGAMAIMIVVAKIAASMSPEEMAQGIAAILAFGGIVVGLMGATKLIGDGKSAEKIGTSILAISGAIAVMVITAKIAASMDPSELAIGLSAVVAFSAIIVGLMAVTKLIGGAENAENLGNTILMIGASIGIMAVAVALLSLIDPSRLTGATVALSIIMGMFALVVKAASTMNAAIASLAVITVAIGILSFILYKLSELPIESSLGAAAALSLVLLATSASMVILSMVGKSAKDALLGVLALTAMAIPLLAFVGVLALMQNVQNATANAYALTILATAMTLLLVPLTIVGAFGTSGLPFIGVLALTAMAIPLLAFVGVLALMQNIQNATTNANLLITLITTMTAVLIALSIVGPLALIGVTALAALSGLIIGLGVLAVGIGALMEKFPALQGFLDTGIPVLIQLAGGIGKMIGAFVGGIFAEIASTLPAIGMCLSQFMANVMPFITGAKLVDESVLAGVGILAGAILALTVADVVNGVLSFLNGGASFADLGTQLSLFMMNAMPFITGASLLTPEMTEGVKNLAETILILTGANILEGLTSWFTGGASIADFGTELAAFGPSLKSFADSVAGIDGASVTAAANAAKTLAEMTATIPNEGGIVGWFAGENSIAKFATEIIALGVGLKGFSDSVEGISPENVTSAANAAKALAQMADTIPNEGGIVAWFTGDNSISKFASHLPTLGVGLKGFSDSVEGISPENVTSAANAAKALAQMADTTPKNTDKLESFGTNLVTFGGKLKSYFEQTSGITADAISASNNAIKAIEKFSTSINPSSVSSASNAIDEIVKSVQKLSKIKASAADGFNSAIKKIGETNVDSLIKAFKGAESKMNTAGQNVLKKLIDGINSQKSKVSTVSKEAATKFVDGIKDKYSSAKSAGSDLAKKAADGMGSSKNTSAAKSSGKDLGAGLVKGIEAKYDAAYDAGYKLGQKAVQGEKDGQKSNSPSKLTIQAGKWLGEGLIIGMQRMNGKVYNAGSELGESATGTLSSVISRISDVINSDIDAQPTIRPVLDLSDVRSGASTIGSMFDSRATVGVAANINAISAMMNQNQNGANDDVVSAINRLRKDLGNVGGTTYNVNGVSYDDGTNVSNAVGSLVRAIKLERRT